MYVCVADIVVVWTCLLAVCMSVCLSGPQCMGVYDFDVRCQVSDLAVSLVDLIILSKIILV